MHQNTQCEQQNPKYPGDVQEQTINDSPLHIVTYSLRSLYWLSPSNTMCIHPQLKVVPNKSTPSSSDSEVGSQPFISRPDAQRLMYQ